MLQFLRRRFSGDTKTKPQRATRRHPLSRRLLFEGLEHRALLSASPAGLAAAGTVVSISNSSFEVPALTTSQSYQYNPTGSSWTFNGMAGVSNNGSAFTASNANAPDGTQVAFLQGTGSMTQQVYLDAGAYSVSFLAAQRGTSQTHYQMLYVTVDGNRVAYVTPSSTTYYGYQTQTFYIATAGTHTILIRGLNPQGGDNTALIDKVVVESEANAIADNSFESPGIATKTFQYTPDGTPWKFSGSAGISSNSSTFTASNYAAPDGTQVAFLQGTGSMSQSVYLDAGSYAITIYASQRAWGQTRNQQIAILVDGVQVGQTTPGSTAYIGFQTSSFPVSTSGMHTIQFAGLNPQGGDNTALIDYVSVTKSNGISDSSFEVPGLLTKTFKYGATGSLWTFTGTAGISANNSGFTSGNSSAPSGTQVAFVQGTGSMSQSIYLDAGGYSMSFKAAQRGTCQAAYQQLYITVDGNRIGYVTPISTSYSTYYTLNFSVATSGMHTLIIRGLNPQGGDNTVLIDDMTVATQSNAINDGSFESPTMTSATFKYQPDGLPWQFTGLAGVSTNGSNFTSANPNTSTGSQVAFLQYTGTMSQAVYLDAGNYAVSFLAAQRVLCQASFQQIGVQVDGTQIATITPTGSSYLSYQTPSFSISTSGMHTITLVGLNPQGGDNTAFIDSISVGKASPISNGTFETPSLTAGTYQYQPSGSLWQYTGTAGISSNNSALMTGGVTAPGGTQVGFLQGASSISQSVYLSAGNYALTFQAAQSPSVAQLGSQQIAVMLDDVQVGLITPSGTSYNAYQTPSILVATAGTHTIRLVGLDPQSGGSIAFIDNVQLLSS